MDIIPKTAIVQQVKDIKQVELKIKRNSKLTRNNRASSKGRRFRTQITIDKSTGKQKQINHKMW